MHATRSLTAIAAFFATVNAANAGGHAIGAVRAGTPQWMQMRLHGLLHGMPSPRAEAPTSETAPSQTPSLTFTFLDYPGTSYTNLETINLGASAHAKQYGVGVYGPALAGAGNYAGFLITLTAPKGAMSETYTPVLPNESSVFPVGVNDHGEIVGFLGQDESSTGFLLKNGVVTSIIAPYPDVQNTSANGITNNGTIVGGYQTSNDSQYGFTWKNGTYTQVPPYPGASQTWPWSINNKGDQSGYVTDSAGNTHGFLLVNGAYTLLDYPGAGYTIAIALNDLDQVVGFYCMTAAECGGNEESLNGFLYANGTYTALNVPGITYNVPSGINNSGVIAGSYIDTNGFWHSYMATQQ